MNTDLHPILLVVFGVLLLIMLLLDLGVFNRKEHEISSKEALVWSFVWITLSMLFSGFIYWNYNTENHKIALEKFYEFQTAYWIEKALSIDNLFVFILVFSIFKVPKNLHHKVLFFGVLGAIVLRAIFIFAGIGIIDLTYLPNFEFLGYKFHLNPHDESLSLSWKTKDFFRINVVLSLFGVFLIYAGIKSWRESGEKETQDFQNSIGVKLVKKIYKINDNFEGGKFFIIQNGIKMATPLLIVIAVVEFTDLLFAVDSIPAVFAVSKDPFILYTSNIFAIMGLRSLYFLLANFINMFDKLPYGLAFILGFIGVKMLLSPVLHIPSFLSLMVVGGILILSVLISIIFPNQSKEKVS